MERRPYDALILEQISNAQVTFKFGWRKNTWMHVQPMATVSVMRTRLHEATEPHDCPHPQSPGLSYNTASTVFYYHLIRHFLSSVPLLNKYNIFVHGRVKCTWTSTQNICTTCTTLALLLYLKILYTIYIFHV